MALDGIFLRHIKREIERQALGARVNQVYQPGRDELVLTLRTYDGMKKLLISARPDAPRLGFISQTPENPASPPMFCMLLRKRVGGGKLVSVRQQGCDRVIFLDFECVNELGDTVFITFACELTGMYSNVIVFNRDSGVIIDSLRRVDLSVSQRPMLPNLKYEPPAAQNKRDIVTESPGDILGDIRSLPAEQPLSRAVVACVQGVSPIIGRELEHRVCEGATNRLEGALADRLLLELERFKALVTDCAGTPCAVYREDGKPMELSFMPVEQYGAAVKLRRFESFCQAADEFYGEREARERMRVKSHSLNKLLQNLRDRAARKLQKQHVELERCADREELRIRGDLLQANLYRIERGAAFAEVENFYDENGGALRIPLNPAISPAANAQRFYKEYQKAKNAESFLADQLEKGRAELEYLDSVLDEVSRAQSERELLQIREELTEQGYLRAPKGKRQKQGALPPLRFESSDGFEIFVGRNNRQNDILTLKTASKTDLWLHTKDIHGSHVIISCAGKQPTEKTILEAAALAAYHSKARESANVPVDYTLVKYVSKPAGAKPGMVIYVNQKTVYVDPCERVES